MQKHIRASAQDFGEPSDRTAVQEGGGHRRPEPSGAPPSSEANHEAKPPFSPAGLSADLKSGQVDSISQENHDGYAVLSQVGPRALEAAVRRAEARGTLVRLLVRHVLGRRADTTTPARKAA